MPFRLNRLFAILSLPTLLCLMLAACGDDTGTKTVDASLGDASNQNNGMTGNSQIFPDNLQGTWARACAVQSAYVSGHTYLTFAQEALTLMHKVHAFDATCAASEAARIEISGTFITGAKNEALGAYGLDWTITIIVITPLNTTAATVMNTFGVGGYNDWQNYVNQSRMVMTLNAGGFGPADLPDALSVGDLYLDLIKVQGDTMQTGDPQSVDNTGRPSELSADTYKKQP